jgi:myosin heavy subunit
MRLVLSLLSLTTRSIGDGFQSWPTICANDVAAQSTPRAHARSVRLSFTSKEDLMPNRRSNLQKMAREKSRSAFDRASKAIQLLQEQRRPIDFKAVAQASNVSLAYLYRNNELKNLIERLQAEQVLNRSGSGRVIIDAVNDKRLEVVRLLDENASLRATNKRLQDQNKRLKAENEIIHELEGQVMKLTRENDRMMKRTALLSAGLSKRSGTL